MNKKSNFNTRAKKYLSSLGYVTEMVEHYNAFSGRKNDFCGFADAISLNPDASKDRILAVQITSKSNVAARFGKITKPFVKDGKTGEEVYNPVPAKAKLWLKAGGGLWIIGFDADKAKQGKVREVLLDDAGDFVYRDTAVNDLWTASFKEKTTTKE